MSRARNAVGDNVLLPARFRAGKQDDTVVLPIPATLKKVDEAANMVEAEVRWDLVSVYHPCDWIDFELGHDVGHDIINARLDLFISTVQAQVSRMMQLKSQHAANEKRMRMKSDRSSSFTTTDDEESRVRGKSMMNRIIRESTRSLFLDNEADIDKSREQYSLSKDADEIAQSNIQEKNEPTEGDSNLEMVTVAKNILLYLGSCFRLLVALSVIPDSGPDVFKRQTLRTLQNLQVVTDELTMQDIQHSMSQRFL